MGLFFTKGTFVECISEEKRLVQAFLNKSKEASTTFINFLEGWYWVPLETESPIKV